MAKQKVKGIRSRGNTFMVDVLSLKNYYKINFSNLFPKKVFPK